MEFKNIKNEQQLVNPFSKFIFKEKVSAMDTNCALKAAIVTVGGGGINKY